MPLLKLGEIGEISKTKLKEKVLINFKFNIATLWKALGKFLNF